MRSVGIPLVFLPIITFIGCAEGPKLVGADGKPVDLRRYECIKLASVEIDSKLGLSGLPGQLKPAIQAELSNSERWAYRGESPSIALVSGHRMLGNRSPQKSAGTSSTPADSSGTADSQPSDCHAATLSVMIIAAEIPTSGQRAFDKPRSMTCRIELSDSLTRTPLFSREVTAKSGLTMGQKVLVGVLLGPGGTPPPEVKTKINRQ